MEHIRCMRRNRRGRERDEREKRRTERDIRELREMRVRRLLREEAEQQLREAQQQAQQQVQQQPLQQQQEQQPIQRHLIPQVQAEVQQERPLEETQQQEQQPQARQQEQENIQPQEIRQQEHQQVQPQNEQKKDTEQQQHARPSQHHKTKEQRSDTQWPLPDLGMDRAKSLSHLDLAGSGSLESALKTLKLVKSRLVKASDSQQSKQTIRASISDVLDTRSAKADTTVESSSSSGSSATACTGFSEPSLDDSKADTTVESSSSSGSSATACTGFSEPSLDDLSTFEASYVSAVESPERQSTELNQQGNNSPVIRTPQQVVPPPALTPPKHKNKKSIKNLLRQIDQNTTTLAQRHLGRGPKEPTVQIVHSQKKECDVCQNSRFLSLSGSVQKTLRCTCDLRLTHGSTPPASPPGTTAPPPSPRPRGREGPVTRYQGERQGEWTRQEAFVKYQK